MFPERKSIVPEYVATQQQRFDAAAQLFGQVYSGYQSIFSVGTDVIRRLTGRPTSAQETVQAANTLTEERLNLAEVRARQTAQGTPTDDIYRLELSSHFAQEYIRTGEEILTAVQKENTNLGNLDAIYRANMTPFGSALRLAGGLGLIIASSADVNWIQNPNIAVTAAEIGIFIGATGVIDTARHIFLQAFQRSRFGLQQASTSNLLRRRASIHEGQITGDEIEDAQPINQQLEQRLSQETLDQLQLDGITRPNLANIVDYSDILRQRTSLRSRLSRSEDLRELVRSRDIARVSRLTRTLLYTALAAGLIFIHMQRAEFCGTGPYVGPDRHTERATGGATSISSWKGLAESVWFKRIFRVDFDVNNPWHRELFDTTYDLDPEGNVRLVQDIVTQLKRKNNDQITTVTRDFFRHGPVRSICDGELDRIYNTP